MTRFVPDNFSAEMPLNEQQAFGIRNSGWFHKAVSLAFGSRLNGISFHRSQPRSPALVFRKDANERSCVRMSGGTILPSRKVLKGANGGDWGPLSRGRAAEQMKGVEWGDHF